MKIGVRNLYQNDVYGNSNKLVFLISFVRKRWNVWHLRWASRQYLVKIKTRFTLCYREDLWVDKERHMGKTNVVVEWKDQQGYIWEEKIQKLWKASGSKDKYLDAKWKAWHVIYTAKINAEKKKLASVRDNKKKSSVSLNKCMQKIRM